VALCNAATNAGPLSDPCPAGQTCLSEDEGAVGALNPGYCGE
jgi:hypothetical protein